MFSDPKILLYQQFSRTSALRWPGFQTPAKTVPQRIAIPRTARSCLASSNSTTMPSQPSRRPTAATMIDYAYQNYSIIAIANQCKSTMPSTIATIANQCKHKIAPASSQTAQNHIASTPTPRKYQNASSSTIIVATPKSDAPAQSSSHHQSHYSSSETAHRIIFVRRTFSVPYIPAAQSTDSLRALTPQKRPPNHPTLLPKKKKRQSKESITHSR